MKTRLMLILFLIIILLFGCSRSSKKTTPDEKLQNTIIVSAPKTVATIPLLRMIDSNALGAGVKIDLQLFGDLEKLMVIAVREDYGFLILPIHTAAVLYNKGVDVKLMHVSVWGGIYLSSTEDDCQQWQDLKGQQLYLPNKGSVPDILARYFLEENGLKMGENLEIINTTYPQIAQLFKMEKIKYAVDGEPFATSNKTYVQNYRVILDFCEEWKKTSGDKYSLPAYGVVVNEDFLKENQAFVKIFNREYSRAVQWVSANPAEAGVLAEKHLNLNSKLITKAIPGLNFSYQLALNAKMTIEKYYNILFNSKPESIGGKVPNENFYYQEE